MAAGLALAGLVACSGDNSSRIPLENFSAKEIYDRGEFELSRGRPDEAAVFFGEVERLYPYSEWAKRALIMQAFALHRDTNYEASRASAQRFLDFYPTDTDAAYAQYLLALSYYDQIDEVGRDQGLTFQALQALREGAQGMAQQLAEAQQGEGQGPGNQQARPGGQQSLADRQQALRNELNRQQQNLPGAGTPEGDAAREALDRAGRAMEGAEDALREEDFAGALDNQSEAIEALREGMRELGEQMAQQQGQPGQQGDQVGEAHPLGQRAPLGREAGRNGRLGTDEQLLQGDDVYRRARELLDEIRRRSGEQARPEVELDYLRRLLDRF